MIRRFTAIRPLEPEDGGRFQLVAALVAGLIGGVVLLVVPRGSPWSHLSFFSSVIMGRAEPDGITIPLPLLCLMHLALAELYALIISWFVCNLHQGKAIITGAGVGIVLYLLNLGVVTLALPAWRGNEVGVLFSHVVFGLIVAGAYRGLLRRSVVQQPAH